MRKTHAAPPDARNRRSQFGIRRRAAAGELRQLHKEPGRPPRRVGAQADLLFLCLLSGGLGRDWDEGGKPVMTRTQSLLTGVWLGVLLLGLAGCGAMQRSEEHTSELQSQSNLVCRLLLEKKKTLHIPRL